MRHADQDQPPSAIIESVEESAGDGSPSGLLDRSGVLRRWFDVITLRHAVIAQRESSAPVSRRSRFESA